MRIPRATSGVALALVAGSGCALREATLAAPQDVIVAEVVLQAGDTQQLAWIHHSVGNGQLTVPGATVEVSSAGGPLVTFTGTTARTCVDSSATVAPSRAGSCYLARTAPGAIAAGGSYALRIVLPGGATLTGTTVVPGAFRLTRPGGAPRCALQPGTLLPVTWTRSSGAWLYISETQLHGVRAALEPGAPDGGMDLVGLSLSAADTTILFPADFGVFNRADSADAPILLALQNGLPANVAGTVGVAAADRNYVQWVRRPGFNPSGTVQIPSIGGAGTGVFGSVVTHRFDVTSAAALPLPSCGGR